MVRRQQPTPSKSFRFPRKPLVLVVLFIILGGLVGVAAYMHRSTWFSNNKKTATTQTQKPVTAGQQTKGQSSFSAGANNQQNTYGTWPSDTKAPANSSSSDNNTKLVVPSGVFVSNHHPNLSGSPAPSTEQSSCVTIAGATCQISFTQGAVTKSLPAQTTDAGGGTSWSWKIQDLGLTTGAWTVTAKATLGSQTQTATDAITLDVEQ